MLEPEQEKGSKSRGKGHKETRGSAQDTTQARPHGKERREKKRRKDTWCYMTDSLWGFAKLSRHAPRRTGRESPPEFLANGVLSRCLEPTRPRDDFGAKSWPRNSESTATELLRSTKRCCVHRCLCDFSNTHLQEPAVCFPVPFNRRIKWGRTRDLGDGP